MAASCRSTYGVAVIPPEAVAIAERRAAEDRATLARLIRERKVRRDSAMGALVPGARKFKTEIEELVRPTPNLAIRPNKRRRR